MNARFQLSFETTAANNRPRSGWISVVLLAIGLYSPAITLASDTWPLGTPPPLSLRQMVRTWPGDGSLQAKPENSWPADGSSLPEVWQQSTELLAAIPRVFLEETAVRFLRGRAKGIPPGSQDSFLLATDLLAHPETYQHRPVYAYGWLTHLRKVPDEQGRSFYVGSVELYGSDSVTIQVLLNANPLSRSAETDGAREGAAQTPATPSTTSVGKIDRVPVEVVGYLQGYHLDSPADIRNQPKNANEPVEKTSQAATVEWWLLAGRHVDVLKTELPETRLLSIKDRTRHVREEEISAYYHALVTARMTPPAVFREAATQSMQARATERQEKRRTPYVDVFKRPQTYRGELVTLEGTARKLITYRANENGFGIGWLYELWVFPDGGQRHPAVVVFTEKPQGLALGDRISQRVRFSGYFFKLYGYDTEDKTLLAPLFLTRTVTVLKPVDEGFPLAWIVGGLAVLGVCFAAYLWTSPGSWRKSKPSAESAEEPPPDFRDLSIDD